MATIRKIRAAIGVALFAVLLVGIVPTAAFGASGCQCAIQAQHREVSRAGNPSGWAVYMATIEARLENQVGSLILNRRLSDLAREHTRAMVAQHRLFHSPEPGAYLRGIAWSTWGENVGYTTGNTSDLQQAFMASLEHRHNILDNQFQHVAVGSIKTSTSLWVTVFFYG